MAENTDNRTRNNAGDAIAFIRRDSAYRLNTLAERITESVKARVLAANGRWVAPSVAWRDSA